MGGTFTVIPIDAPSSEKCELPDARGPYVEVEQGHAPPSCFSFHTASQRPSHGMFSATFFAFPCILLVIAVFKMAPMCHGEVLAGVPDHKKGVLCLKEKIHVLEKLGSGMSYREGGHEFNANERQYILNKVSLNRQTPKAKS